MAKDAIHDQVRNALENDGWTILKEQFKIGYEELDIFADLVAERKPLVIKKESQKIIVEVKTFGGRSFMRELQQAIGQYNVYFEIIKQTKMEYELYLAISENVYEEYFCAKGTSQIIRAYQIKLLVVDIGREEIIKWIN